MAEHSPGPPSPPRVDPWPPGHRGHWWSGWPGAYCMRCGADHALELALADGWYDPVADAWDTEGHRRQVEEADGVCPADRPTPEPRKD